MDFYIDPGKSQIFIQQKWKYTWNVQMGCTAWTEQEKKDFHTKVDRLIWSLWAGKFKATVAGTSDFAKNYKTKIFTLNFDVKKVTSGEHWKVEVLKIPKGSSNQSYIIWSTRTISLDTEDNNKRNIIRNGKTYHQYPVAHEFGHTSGNSKFASAGMHGDEYKASSPHNADYKSMMNVGSILRKRHMDYAINIINNMIPNTTFNI